MLAEGGFTGCWCAQTLAGRARGVIGADADACQLMVADGGAAAQVWKALQLMNHLEEHLQVGSLEDQSRFNARHTRQCQQMRKGCLTV